MSECTCTFRGVGNPMDTTDCSVHTKAAYTCSKTNCGDYRPKSEPIKHPNGRIIWPRCLCGEIAQEHN